MQRTPIEWADFSANPLKYLDANDKVVWGCVHASPGCQNCYSEALAKRYGRGGRFNVLTMAKLRPFLDPKELHQMRTYKPASGGRVFIGDMTDLFGEWVPDDLLNELFSNVLEIRTDVTWQILTKRAKRMREYLSWRWGDGRIPSRHIWVGVSCENQKYADERIPQLLETPAAVRFVSAEPLLGPVDFTLYGIQGWDEDWRYNVLSGEEWAGPRSERSERSQHLDWVIVGGESGPNARPMHPEWARSIRDQCRDAKVPFFFKQWGEWGPHPRPAKHGVNTGAGLFLLEDGKLGCQGDWWSGRAAALDRVGKKAAGRVLDGRTWDEFPEVKACG